MTIGIMFEHMSWQRLLIEDKEVVGPNWLSRSRRNPLHIPANIIRLLLALVLPPFYLLFYSATSAIAVNFWRASWEIEKAYAPKSFLHDPKRRPGEKLYIPGRSPPRWLVKVTTGSKQNDNQLDVRVVKWEDEAEAIGKKGYIALSYAYKDAKAWFNETYPNIPIDKIPPRPNPSTKSEASIDEFLMTAWKQYSQDPQKQERWQDIAVRQRVARFFLDRYLEATHRPDSTEYIWIDEFCLYSPSTPDLSVRKDELGRIADVFALASVVCVFCPKPHCRHVHPGCAWGNRLWTLSEIIHTENVILWSRAQQNKTALSQYTFTPQSGRHFRECLQYEAEDMNEWHLSSIMRHANNLGSTTWQHSIHALVVEAIRRNVNSNQRNKDQKIDNSCLAKALNGLLPRRANASDLEGKDGWADLAWLLELNQGHYNAASLAAVCALGETKVQGHGWLGRPISPSAGNERLQPVVTAFPIKEGLFVLNPKIIGLRKKLKRDVGGMYRNKDLRFFQVRTVISRVFYMIFTSPFLQRVVKYTPLMTILWVVITTPFISGPSSQTWLLVWLWLGFGITAFVQLCGSSLYIERGGIFLLPSDKLKGGDVETYLRKRDRQLRTLESWGDEQLAPRWEEATVEAQEATLVDLMSQVKSKFLLRKWEGKPANALLPLAIHGCGVTCLVLHHYDDHLKPAIKLGIVNMPPYILTIGQPMGSLVVGAVPEEKVLPVAQSVETRYGPYLPQYNESGSVYKPEGKGKHDCLMFSVTHPHKIPAEWHA